MKLSKLIGKTISKAKYRNEEGYDDMPYLDLTFTDGVKVTVEGGYGGYTGNSIDEYQVWISVERSK